MFTIEASHVPTEIFPGLPVEKRKILGKHLVYYETTFSDDCACKMCNVNTPLGLQAIMPSSLIQAIHRFIGDGYKKEHGPAQSLCPHFRGQLIEYFDPDTGWDMADVLQNGLLTTERKFLVYLHGVDPANTRAINAL